ncbi:MAG: hypothetical protein WCZ19_01100 [Acholeplasma sp.]
MAIWQFNFGLANDNNKEIINKFKHDISLMYVINKSWSDRITLYGDLDGTCIEIGEYNNNYEIDFRLDLRTITVFELNLIIEIIKKYTFKIIYKGKVLEPDLDIIKKEIIESKEFKCCENPKQYFGNL